MSCKDCSKRHVGCHSSCEDYLNFLKENEERKRKRYEENIDRAYNYENKQLFAKKRFRKGA